MEPITEIPAPTSYGSEIVMYILLAGIFIVFGVLAWWKMNKKRN